MTDENAAAIDAAFLENLMPGVDGSIFAGVRAQVDPKAFAIEAHGEQKYAGEPYIYHLLKVERALEDAGFYGFRWRAAAMLHDVIEDTYLDLPYEDRRDIVADTFGEDVAKLVWAVTGIGPNRKARNEEIYRKLGEYPEACILKCADRIANVEASILDPATNAPNLGMAKMYLKERERFTEVVKPHVPVTMWFRLESGFERLATLVAAGG